MKLTEKLFARSKQMEDKMFEWASRLPDEPEVPEVVQTEENFLSGYRKWAFRLLAGLIVAATVVGLTESFNGLYIWFSTHYVTGFWADFAPIAIDSFSVIGELAIFVALTGHWHWKKRLIPWFSVLLGFSGSVAGNIGRVAQHHMITVDLTALTFPIAGAFGILIGFSVLKSLAKEVADTSYAQSLVSVTAEVIPNMAVSTEGLKELEEEKFTAPVPHLEAPQLKGLDALIPPREMPDARVPVAEDGANTQTEWRGLPEGAQKLRRPDFQTTIRNTGQFPVVQ